jgi:hypothetical protein
MDRNDGSVDFYRTYSDYEVGFGSPFTETWIGKAGKREADRIKTEKEGDRKGGVCLCL